MKSNRKHSWLLLSFCLFLIAGYAPLVLRTNAPAEPTAAPVPANNPNFLNVQDYYQKGDKDHTKAFQRCFDAVAKSGGRRKVIVPAKSDGYVISSPVVFQQGGTENPSPKGQVFITLEGVGKGSPIYYKGPPGTSAFVLKSMTFSEVNNLFVFLQANQTIAFDWQSTNGQGGGFCRWRDVVVNFGTWRNCIGWRLGWDSIYNGCFADIIFTNCMVTGPPSNPYNGCIGWQVCGANGYPIYYFGCGASFCHSMIWSGPLICNLSANITATQTTIPVYNSYLLPSSGSCKILNSGEIFTYTGNTQSANGQLTGVTRGTGAKAVAAGGSVAQYLTITDSAGKEWGVVPGGDQQYVVGGSGSGLVEVFAFIPGNIYAIRDFAYENAGVKSSRYMRLGDALLNGGNAQTMFSVAVESGRIMDCGAPPDGQGVCRLAANVNLHFKGMAIAGPGNNTLYSASSLPFCFQVAKGRKTLVSYENCNIQASLPFDELQGPKPHFKHSALWDASFNVATVIPETSPNTCITLTDGNTVTIDLSLSDSFELPYNNSYDRNRTLKIVNSGYRQHWRLKLRQTARGGSTVTTWNSSGAIRWQGGSYNPTTKGNKGDMLEFSQDSLGAWWATPHLNY